MPGGISPDGKTLATWRSEGDIKLWDVAEGKVKAGLKEGGPIDCLAFSPDGTTLAAKGADGVHLWDVAAGKVTATLKGGRGAYLNGFPCNCLAFSPDGKLLALGGGDGSIKVWELHPGK